VAVVQQAIWLELAVLVALAVAVLVRKMTLIKSLVQVQ
jgi:hypothetical protein